jgi:hypothetical protein
MLVLRHLAQEQAEERIQMLFLAIFRVVKGEREKIMRSRYNTKWIVLVLLSLMVLPGITAAQSDRSTSTRPIYIMQGDKIAVWNFDTFQSNPVISLGSNFIRPNGLQVQVQKTQFVQNISLNSQTQFLDRIDVTAVDYSQRMIYGRLVHTDLNTK